MKSLRCRSLVGGALCKRLKERIEGENHRRETSASDHSRGPSKSMLHRPKSRATGTKNVEWLWPPVDKFVNKRHVRDRSSPL